MPPATLEDPERMLAHSLNVPRDITVSDKYIHQENNDRMVNRIVNYGVDLANSKKKKYEIRNKTTPCRTINCLINAFFDMILMVLTTI